MMESGDLTMEEGEIELKDIELRENKDNKFENNTYNNNQNELVTPDYLKATKQQLTKERHATIVPSMCQKNTQRSKQSAHGGKERTAPKCNNGKETDIDTKGNINKNSGDPDKLTEGDARSNSEQWLPKKIQSDNNVKRTTIISNKTNKKRKVTPNKTWITVRRTS